MPHLFIPALVLLAVGCAPADDTAPESPDAPDTTAAVEMSVQDEFWASLEALCGNAYAGTVVEGSPEDTVFAGKDLIMHVRECEDDVIHVPFHVGENHSRTWVFTQTDDGLRLKHDHRHEDGSEDEVTQYGGDTADEGTATRQEFPADAYTTELIPYAATNIWTVEIEPGERYSYALRREGTDRRIRVDFDLTQTVPAPPTPWGY